MSRLRGAATNRRLDALAQRCGDFHLSAVFSWRICFLVHLTIRPPESDSQSESYRAVLESSMNQRESRMTALGVRRDKAALSSGCKSHPANAPAGSSRSSYGGDEIAEAFGMRVTNSEGFRY